MTIQNLSLLKALGAKMDYLNRRQGVIAQNIANADTPGYRPRDLQKADFGSLLGGLGQKEGGMKTVSLAITNPSHQGPGMDVRQAGDRAQKNVYEVSPVGNAVVIEEQLLNAGQTASDYNLVTSLYQKNVRMIKTALGVS